MAKKVGLGRGLEAIFMDNTTEQEKSVSFLDITQIEPKSDQPRKNYDEEELEKLAESIQTHGLIQPIVVRALDTGLYQIIAGERRWRAAKKAGLLEVPVFVMDVDDKKAAEIALIENIQRENLNPIEEATAYRSLLQNYNLTYEELSLQVGKDRATISNMLRLLELPPEVLELLRAKQITAGHARTLLGLKDTDSIVPTALLVQEKELSVRATETLVRLKNQQKENTLKEDVSQKSYFTTIERRAMEKTGRKIKIKKTRRLKRIEIQYENNEDFQKVLSLLFGNDFFEEEETKWEQ